MEIIINNNKIHYNIQGKGEKLLLLHGWGCDIKIFKPLMPYFEQHFETYSIDFPGFGQSPEPAKAWTNDDYVALTKSFIEELNIDKPIILGHSFGGRVAIKLATQIRIHKLILTGSAGIKPSRSLNYYAKVYSYKLLKNLAKVPLLSFLLKPLQETYIQNMGSSDYKQASDIMRETLSNVVNTDLQSIMPDIKTPTLLIFGENDTATPPEYGKIMEKLISGSGLIIMKNAGHYTFLDQQAQFTAIIDSFLAEDKL